MFPYVTIYTLPLFHHNDIGGMMRILTSLDARSTATDATIKQQPHHLDAAGFSCAARIGRSSTLECCATARTPANGTNRTHAPRPSHAGEHASRESSDHADFSSSGSAYAVYASGFSSPPDRTNPRYFCDSTADKPTACTKRNPGCADAGDSPSACAATRVDSTKASNYCSRPKADARFAPKSSSTNRCAGRVFC